MLRKIPQKFRFIRLQERYHKKFRFLWKGGMHDSACESAAFYQLCHKSNLRFADNNWSTAFCSSCCPESVNCFYDKVGKTLHSHSQCERHWRRFSFSWASIYNFYGFTFYTPFFPNSSNLWEIILTWSKRNCILIEEHAFVEASCLYWNWLIISRSFWWNLMYYYKFKSFLYYSTVSKPCSKENFWM